jgi:hypothetical protein
VKLQLFWPTAVDVDVSAVADSATAADFVFDPVHLTLSPDGQPVTVTGEIVGDVEPEGDEVFFIRATGAPSNSSPYSYVYSSGGRVEIKDDDDARASRLHVDGARVPEGNKGATLAALTVRLEPASTYTVSVDYAVADGPGGGDVQPGTGTLTFAPGETTKTITVLVNGDTVWERDETATVVLSNPRHAVLGTATAELVIVNDDAPSVVTIADTQILEGNAGSRQVSLVAHYDHPLPPQTKLHVNVVSGSADGSNDFQPGFTVFYPPAGAVEFPFTVAIYGDTTPECDEGVIIEYAGIYTGDETRKTAHLLLKNDDVGPLDSGCSDPFARRAPWGTVEDGGVPPDAAVPPDAGVSYKDAGDLVPDGGAGGAAVDAPAQATIDAAAVQPAAPDAGTGSNDAAASAPPTLAESSGCSLAGAATATSLPAAGLLALLGLSLRRRLRRWRRR